MSIVVIIMCLFMIMINTIVLVFIILTTLTLIVDVTTLMLLIVMIIVIYGESHCRRPNQTPYQQVGVWWSVSELWGIMEFMSVRSLTARDEHEGSFGRVSEHWWSMVEFGVRICLYLTGYL